MSLTSYINVYRKVASSSLSRLVAHFWVFRLFMQGKFYAYVLWPLAKTVQNWIVDRCTARDFMVVVPWNSTIGLITYTHTLFFPFFPGYSEIDGKTAEPQKPAKRIPQWAQQIVRQGQAQWVEHKCISIRHRILSGLTLPYIYEPCTLEYITKAHKCKVKSVWT